MKHLTTLLLVLAFFSGSLLAQTSNLVVFSEQGEQFSLVLNAVQQNSTPQTNIKVSGLAPGACKVKIIFSDGTTPDIDKTLYFDPANEYTYNVKKDNKGEYVLRILNMVPIAQAPPPPPSQTVIVYSTVPPPIVGTSTTVTQTTTTTGDPNDNVNMNVGMNIGGMGIGMNVNVNDNTGMGNSTTTTTYTQSTTTTTNSSSNYGYYDNTPPPPPQQTVYVQGYSGPVGCPYPMNQTDFYSAKSSISSKDFESTKLDIAKQVTNSNCFTADQIKEIMGLFDFEASKLEYAKYAYGHCYDKGNYFKVNDAFEFETSISELQDYIGGH